VLADEVLVQGLIELSDGFHRFIEIANQMREGVAEKSADADQHIDPRPTEFG
jgi:hypothetical protein